MNENIRLLIKKFQEIEGKGWIRSISKSFGGIGLTFENEHGYSDKDYPEYKVLATNLSYKYKTTIKSGVKFKLHINTGEEKLYLNIYDSNNNIVESESFVYLDSIKLHLLLKLNLLALVYAENKKDENSKYFHYYKMAIYELKPFEKFIELLKEDIVKVILIARIEKSGNEIGRYRNKNLIFQINKLFKQIDLQ